MQVSNKEINKFLEQEILIAKKFFQIHKINHFFPKLIISGIQYNKLTKVYCEIQGKFDNSVDKFFALNSLGKEISKQNIQPYLIALLSEAWMTPILKDNPFKVTKRKEVFVISCLSIDKKSCLAIIDILRDKQNHISLGNIEKILSNDKIDSMKMKSDLLEQFYKGYNT